MISLANLFGLVSFFPGILGFRGVNISKVKMPGRCHDLQRKCNFLIREWVGLFCIRVKNKGRNFGTFVGSQFRRLSSAFVLKEMLNTF